MTWLYDFVCPTKPRERHTTLVADVETKRKVGANEKEEKKEKINDKMRFAPLLLIH